MRVVYQGCKDLQDKLEEVASQSGYVVYPSRSFDHRHHQPPKMEDSGRQNPPTMTDYITSRFLYFAGGSSIFQSPARCRTRHWPQWERLRRKMAEHKF